MTRITLIFCLLLSGCAGQHVVRTKIPASCIRVTIKDFTKPCEQLADGDLMCDRVRVHPSCVSVSTKK